MRCKQTRRCPMIYLALITLLTPSAYAAWWPFTPKRFSGSGLLPAGSLGLEVEERAIAFGDFNGDQYLDILTLDPDGQTLAVHIWDHDAFTFRKGASFKHPRRVHNAVPGDFTQDGKLDLLVMSESGISDRISMSAYIGKLEGGFSMEPIDVPPSSGVQPIAMDVTGDLRVDLLGLTTSNSRTLKVWSNTWNASTPSAPLFNVLDATFDQASCKIANPHSNAVVDLDGDCLADIFIVCDAGNEHQKEFQIWSNTKTQGFKLAQSGRLPPGTQAITFSDVDRDGAIDMVFATCDSTSRSTGIGSDCILNIAYNVQIPLCQSTTTPDVVNNIRVCRPLANLCMRDPSAHFDFDQSDGHDAFQQIPFSSILPESSDLLVFDTTFSPTPLPLPLRTGDFNLDGFPDLLFIRALSRNAEHTPTLLMNVACGTSGSSKCEKGGRRAWKVVKQGAEPFEKVKDARGVAFIDIDEDGTLDFMVQRTGKDGQGKISFVQNNFYHDAFFLKAIVLNSACPGGWCTATNGSTYHPYGVSYSGGTFKYTVIGTTGSRSAAQVVQLPQMAYHAMHAPYAFLGLGRTNNYIETLFAGSTSHAQEHFTVLEGVVPNSRVVALPPHPAKDGAGEEAWRTELFLRPGAWIHWVGATVVVVLIMLSGVVAGLHVAEKRADEKERRMASHHINFDAL